MPLPSSLPGELPSSLPSVMIPLLVPLAVPPWRSLTYFINIIEFLLKTSMRRQNENTVLLIPTFSPLCIAMFLCYYRLTETILEVPTLPKDPILLRLEYIKNPPDGLSADDIRNMSIEDLLDLDYFLNEDPFGFDELGADFFF